MGVALLICGITTNRQLLMRKNGICLNGGKNNCKSLLIGGIDTVADQITAHICYYKGRRWRIILSWVEIDFVDPINEVLTSPESRL